MHGVMSAAALLGPGRAILAAGWRSAVQGAPDMNSLVSLGAVAAFGVSCVAAAMPQLAWRTFFEEPAMLLGVVLLGRTLEQRAKLQASSDMAALRVRPFTSLRPFLRHSKLTTSCKTSHLAHLCEHSLFTHGYSHSQLGHLSNACCCAQWQRRSQNRPVSECRACYRRK